MVFRAAPKGLPRPWRTRQGTLSPLRIGVLAGMALPVPLIAWQCWIIWDGFYRNLGLFPHPTIVFYSGSVALWLLLLTLAVTPFRRMLGWNRLIGVRRLLGVGAFAYAAGHTLSYLFLRNFEFAVITNEVASRATLDIALVTAIALLALAATSSDAAIRRLGGNWRRLHLLAYPATGGAIVHYLLSPGSVGGEPFVMAGLFGWLMGWRLLRRFDLETSLTWLIVLTAVAALATALIHLTVLLTLHGWTTSQSLAALSSPAMGLPPALVVALAGLVGASAPALGALARKLREAR